MVLGRRDVLAGLGGVIFSAAADQAWAADKVVKVGVSLAMSGPVASLGEDIWRGANLYYKLNQASLPKGVSIELLLRDDGGSSDNIKRIVQEFVVRERVQLLAGGTISPQAFAVAPLATQSKTPFVVLNASTASITRESPNFVRTSATLWQTGCTMGEWSAKNGYKKVYTFVADYAAGLDVESAFTHAFTKNGGEIVGSVHVPVATTDYLPYMQNIKSSGADAVFIFVVAGRIGPAVAAFNGAGLKKTGIRIIGTGDLAEDDKVAHLSDDVAGLVTAGVYYAANPIPANVSFVKAWKAEYGAESLPNFLAVGGWDGMAAIFELVGTTGGNFSSAQAMAFFSNWKTSKSPRGSISIDPATRDIIQTVYINRVEMVDGVPTNVSFDKVNDVRDPWKELNPPK